MNRAFLIRNAKHWLKRALRRSSSGRVSVGRHTYGAARVRWWGEDANLTIGSFCSIAEGVEIYLGGNHRIDWVTTFPFSEFADRWPEARGVTGHPASRGDVVIGNDVWLGAGSVILSGVTIGDGAVIGARAVVGRDVRPYAVVAGNPAVERRRRFDDATVEKLLACAWWNWPEESVRRHMHLLMGGDVNELLAACVTTGSTGPQAHR